MLPSVLVAAAFATGFANPPDARVKRHFVSDSYTVTWGKVVEFDPSAELEVTDAHDHFPWNLDWYRFRPGKDGVDVLRIRYLPKLEKPQEQKNKAKWPRVDDYGVTVKSARMKSEDYKSLLHDLAVVSSAMLKETEEHRNSSTWHHFVWHTSLTADKKTLLDLNWTGAPDSDNEWRYTKPKVAVELSQEVVWVLDFKDYTLSDDDRAWASAKFARDWKMIKDEQSAWWVRDRALCLIGEVGDASVLSILRDILNAEPLKIDPEEPRTEDAKRNQEYEWYRAINAVTRLLGKDVRDKPVEEMDVEKTRKKVLELLKDVK